MIKTSGKSIKIMVEETAKNILAIIILSHSIFMYQYIFALVLDNVDCYSSLDVAAPHQLGALCQILINGGCQFPTWQTWIRNKKKERAKIALQFVIPNDSLKLSIHLITFGRQMKNLVWKKKWVFPWKINYRSSTRDKYIFWKSIYITENKKGK